MRIRRNTQRGAVALEYVLVCALLMLAIGAAVPYTMRLFAYAYQVISAVVCSPFPTAL